MFSLLDVFIQCIEVMYTFQSTTLVTFDVYNPLEGYYGVLPILMIHPVPREVLPVGEVTSSLAVNDLFLSTNAVRKSEVFSSNSTSL